MLKYDIDIYRDCKVTSCRYTLGKTGSRPLVVIGLNPSTADKERSDMTISKVIQFAVRNNYDGFIMLNLYPERATHPNNLPSSLNTEYHKENINAIINCIVGHKEVNLLAAWGEPITNRSYFVQCLSDIKTALSDHKINWLKIGNITKSGHPRHPSRAGYSCSLNKFNIAEYLNSIYSTSASVKRSVTCAGT